MPSHLPLLLNPLLNALFNNPHPEKSPLKDVYAKLSKSWEDGTVIVVPPLDILLNYFDSVTNTTYSDLCYAEEFLKDHIIVTQETKNAKMFISLSGKELLVKRDTLFTGKGFKRSLQLKITKSEYFQSFNDYFPKGRQFMVMHVNMPLFGEPERSPVINLIAPSSNNVESVVLHTDNGKEDAHDAEEVQPIQHRLSAEAVERLPVRFEQLMRTFPLISRSVGEKYESLFRSFNVKEATDRDTLIEMFLKCNESASHIFQTLSDEIVSTIIDTTPQLDLNECVYSYVELNLFDKIWSKLCDLHDDFLAEHYGELECLSINQVSLPNAGETDLSLYTLLEKKVAKAVTEFKKLELTTNVTSKVEIFVETISILSNIESVSIDADTLVGLLLLVVVHAGVPNLDNHLFYVQNFSFQNIDAGLVGYSLSTFEGLFFYLKDSENLETLKSFSKENRNVFSCIDDKELLQLKKLADCYSREPESSLKARTSNGDSLLMQAIQSNDYDTWELLVDYEEIFPLEDILSDRNISDTSLLNAALNCENFDMIDEITDILLSSCTVEELIGYLNYRDQHSRTIGHYLFHYKELIPKLGPFIDWRIKDLNGQTPLFALCRSYDCFDYAGMIEIVFSVVDNWYTTNNSEFDYQDHVDNRGNTLLHIMNSHIDILLNYGRLNVNEVNYKGYTPLMIYAKYNRLENIKKILEHPAIDVGKTDKNFFTCLDQAKNPQISALIESKFLNEKVFKTFGKQIGVMRVRLENSFWKLSLRGRIDDQPYETLHAFSEFRHLIELMDLEFPNTFIPLSHTLKHFDMLLNFSTFNKLKLNKIVDHLNTALQSFLLNKPLLEYELLWEFLVQPDFNKDDLTQRSKLKLLNYKQDIVLGEANGNGHRHEKDEIFLQPEEISEINFFLKFSLKEFVKLKSTYNNLFKVVSFQARKEIDLNDSKLLLADSECGLSEELQFLSSILREQSKEHQADSELCEAILYLSLSTDEIIQKVNNLINHKIFRWWKLYGELIELNNNYKNFKQVDTKRNNAHANGEVEGLIEVNEEGFHDLTNVTSFTHGQKKKPKKTQPSFLSNFIESKRHKFEAKILDSLRAVKKSLVELNRDIKFNHETMAVEINNFFNYKTDLMKILIKKFVKKQIRDINFQKMMTSRGLNDISALK